MRALSSVCIFAESILLVSSVAVIVADVTRDVDTGTENIYLLFHTVKKKTNPFNIKKCNKHTVI